MTQLHQSGVWKKLLVAFIDCLIINFALGASLLLRFDFKFSMIDPAYIAAWMHVGLWFAAFTVLIFYTFRLYHFIWSFISVRELPRIVLAVILDVVAFALFCLATGNAFPVFVYIATLMLVLFLVVTFRYSYRISYILYDTLSSRWERSAKRVMIIGAGQAGRMLIRELLGRNRARSRVCCVIDDNPAKRGCFLENVPIVGNRSVILKYVKKYDIQEIIFAIPAATAEQKREILQICGQTACTLKTVPGLFQIVTGDITVSTLRPVKVEDLLERESVAVNNESIMSRVSGKSVLVTGGGGSIGSELCRQIAVYNPSRLIIFDVYENNAYEIQQELKHRFPELTLNVQIGSVRDEARVDKLFETYHPEVVFHAAAHKHVPLMEDSPCEAVKNNVFGTLHVARAAVKHGTSVFLLISTDKAVNPTNVMGATKRICEMIVQAMSRQQSNTRFVAVRFGNVLGSNGSVIPLFRRQIEEGGPVTVTDKNVIRYFMTIPEAVTLILQAAAFANSGEIYVLDMGHPVRIDDLARNMIRLSGFEPEVDIPIVYTGLRPGEKMYEEMLMAEEGLINTENQLIYIGKPIPFDEKTLMKQLEELRLACSDNADHIKTMVAEIVGTYRAEVTHCPK